MRSKWAVFSIEALFVAALVVGSVWLMRRDTLPPPQIASGPNTVHFEHVAELSLSETHDVVLDRGLDLIAASGPSPYLVFTKDFAKPFDFVRLECEAILSGDGDFVIHYGVDKKKAGEPIKEHPLNVFVWDLSKPATTCRLDIPRGGAFRLRRLDFGSDMMLTTPPYSGLTSFILPLCVILLAIVLLCQRAGFFPFVESRQVKTGLICGMAGSALLLVYLLPPFQGPDEIQHWKFALTFYRSGAAQETELFRLEEILGTQWLPFHPRRSLDPESLHTLTADFKQDSPMPSSAAYGYVRYHSYPFIWPVAKLFPRVTSVRQALFFFYLCRILPLIFLFGMLFYANRKYELPYTAIFFFSLPAFLQQCSVVSADTLLNVGTIAAVLIFLRLREKFAWPLYAFLCALCLAIVISKVIAAAILLMPLILLPIKKLPRWKTIVAVAAVLAIPAAYIACRVVLDAILHTAQTNPRAAMDEQVAFLSTFRGIKRFVRVYAEYAGSISNIPIWTSHLGWLDAELSGQHLNLLGDFCLFCVFLDVRKYLAPLWNSARRHFSDFATIMIVIGLNLWFITFSDALIYYIMCAEPRSYWIPAIQPRHFFPGMIVAVLLPLALFQPRGNEATDKTAIQPPYFLDRFANSVALVVLPLLFFARGMELTMDLLIRYW